MSKLFDLQFAGPIAVFMAVGAADSACWALSRTPSSSLLWYLNLEVFSVFRHARWMLAEVGAFPFAQFILFAAPLLLIAVLGLVRKRNILIAAASNLSFVYAIFLFASSYAWGSYRVQSASLAALHVPADGHFFLYGIFLIAAASILASHLVYIRLLRAR